MSKVFLFNLPEPLDEDQEQQKILVEHLNRAFCLNEVKSATLCLDVRLEWSYTKFLSIVRESILKNFPEFDQVFHTGHVFCKDGNLIIESRYW